MRDAADAMSHYYRETEGAASPTRNDGSLEEEGVVLVPMAAAPLPHRWDVGIRYLERRKPWSQIPLR